jgi:hypothetical protein
MDAMGAPRKAGYDNIFGDYAALYPSKVSQGCVKKG